MATVKSKMVRFLLTWTQQYTEAHSACQTLLQEKCGIDREIIYHQIKGMCDHTNKKNSANILLLQLLEQKGGGIVTLATFRF